LRVLSLLWVLTMENQSARKSVLLQAIKESLYESSLYA